VQERKRVAVSTGLVSTQHEKYVPSSNSITTSFPSSRFSYTRRARIVLPTTSGHSKHPFATMNLQTLQSSLSLIRGYGKALPTLEGWVRLGNLKLADHARRGRLRFRPPMMRSFKSSSWHGKRPDSTSARYPSIWASPIPSCPSARPVNAA
jgi:hypothetical protein